MFRKIELAVGVEVIVDDHRVARCEACLFAAADDVIARDWFLACCSSAVDRSFAADRAAISASIVSAPCARAERSRSARKEVRIFVMCRLRCRQRQLLVVTLRYARALTPRAPSSHSSGWSGVPSNGCVARRPPRAAPVLRHLTRAPWSAAALGMSRGTGRSEFGTRPRDSCSSALHFV